ncbi:acyl-CoA thioesterase [Croceitalea rosinachiae]|uniref:Thioesterase family protein n=1 Tax=Croceitalea rosinachiae TaxID=3075596 RepID=A0ABU3AAP1_9FLAO|nr:thioesterase family protein [Croceitalea sp. F388]MDT0607254.1 thioesterase family protein [Croceitalea sp. F388]
MNFNKFSFRIRYGETDQMGVVYHGNYAQYLEIGRVEWLRNLDLTYKSMEDNGIILPVIHLQIDYKKSAIYDDLITVETYLKRTPLVKIEFDYKIYNESRELLAEANTILAFIDKGTNKPIKCPNYILEKLI